jgi:hypothetical protein
VQCSRLIAKGYSEKIVCGPDLYLSYEKAVENYVKICLGVIYGKTKKLYDLDLYYLL